MTLQSTRDLFRDMQKAARAADAKARNQDQASLETLFTLTPPISPPEKRKGPQRIKAPRQIEVDDSGQPIIDMGFIAREFAMLGLPHSDPGDLLVYRRTNGKFEFRVTADVDSFLPYGMYPRILGAWVATLPRRLGSMRWRRCSGCCFCSSSMRGLFFFERTVCLCRGRIFCT